MHIQFMDTEYCVSLKLYKVAVFQCIMKYIVLSRLRQIHCHPSNPGQIGYQVINMYSNLYENISNNL